MATYVENMRFHAVEANNKLLEAEADTEKAVVAARAELTAAHFTRTKALEAQVGEVATKLAASEEQRKTLSDLSKESEKREIETSKALDFANKEVARLKAELAAAQKKEPRLEEAIAAWKETSDFQKFYAGECLPLYDQGLRHALRMASADGLPLEQLYRWATADHSCEVARSQHSLIPYADDELAGFAVSHPSWAIPQLATPNFSTLFDHHLDGGKCEFVNGEWVLSEKVDE